MPLTRVASFLKGITSGLASRFNHECPSLPTASATGPEVLSWPQFALTAVNGPQRRTSSAELEESQLWYFQLTSCICDLGSVGDEASTLESDVLPREMTKKELYIHDDEIKQAKTLGVGFASHAIELVVLSALRERSTVKKSMADLNVSLFNMHTTRLADILLRRNVGSLCLVEASHNNAKLVKDLELLYAMVCSQTGTPASGLMISSCTWDCPVKKES
ncbi:hypothetical protein Tcan_07294 [Toxocara canis]|uniref:Uncharacterized protein n=1 Tax=Toxocara canis TaxID=6265 RepID=A0A0B2V8K5_TOXCA|nr:hypothetical protein Tcan_07294 [Toxocara canis]